MKKKMKKNNMGLQPREIVEELDRYIVGQGKAKKAVAIALRNRYRRKNVPDPMKQEIVPKNILMIGPTGVGKTEIARRLAKLANSPFIKVEATKFTEVGYVGKEVESIIRELVEIAINTQKIHAKKEFYKQAEMNAIERVLDALVGPNSSMITRDKFKEKIFNRELDNKEIEINVNDSGPMPGASFDVPGMPGATMGVLNINDVISKALGNTKTKVKKMTVKDALNILVTEESDKLMDHDQVITSALSLVENDGIVFIDEIDKIASDNHKHDQGRVSREGVQRDLLPLIEGTSVTTKYGTVMTDHILFIASGAFHIAKPSDLLPELQGRLPIRVELNPLSKQDMVKILTEPESSLIKQYTALIQTEGVKLEFTDGAIEKIADYATNFNKEVEDIGARRLHTILEKLLEDISYNASEISEKKFVVDELFVDKKLSSLVKNLDLAKFIL
jgi:ATP-dependent HslUV protease ATP-binding subunit HslU